MEGRWGDSFYALRYATKCLRIEATSASVVRMADVTSRRMRRLGRVGKCSKCIPKLFNTPGGVVDFHVEKVARMRRSKTARKGGNNFARGFHRWVHRDQKAFPVQISKLRVPVRLRGKINSKGKRVVTQKKVDFPVILFSSWFKAIMESYPYFFLAGCTLDSPEWGPMFGEFWRWFEGVEPTHPIHQKSESDKQRCVPIALHGDEGRGLAKTPLMVWSFQVIIPSSGPNNLNTTQHPGFSLAFFCHLNLNPLVRNMTIFFGHINQNIQLDLLYRGIPLPQDSCTHWYRRRGMQENSRQWMVFQRGLQPTLKQCLNKELWSKFPGSHCSIKFRNTVFCLKVVNV